MLVNHITVVYYKHETNLCVQDTELNERDTPAHKSASCLPSVASCAKRYSRTFGQFGIAQQCKSAQFKVEPFWMLVYPGRTTSFNNIVKNRLHRLCPCSTS